jgi:RND family efflux transporter MFP subunit
MLTQQIRALRAARFIVVGVAAAAFAAACNRAQEPKPAAAAQTLDTGDTYAVHDTTLAADFDAAGVAAPIQQATLSTRLMGTVTDVLVREGEQVAEGQPLVNIDARDLTAKSAQVTAAAAGAEAMHRDALTQVNRIRALYADSAATRAQLDAAETGLARAEAALAGARGAEAELGAVASYSVIRAPFAGIITKRFVDPGAFAAPGAPLVVIQDVSTLRLTASTTPDIARGLRRGQSLAATIEGQPVSATIEGAVPSLAGNLYTINALVSNPRGRLLAGSAATLAVPTGFRTALVVPTSAIVREGDLTGVTLRTPTGDERRWVRLGFSSGGTIEISAGLRSGDRVVLPTSRVATIPGV